MNSFIQLFIHYSSHLYLSKILGCTQSQTQRMISYVSQTFIEKPKQANHSYFISFLCQFELAKTKNTLSSDCLNHNWSPAGFQLSLYVINGTSAYIYIA